MAKEKQVPFQKIPEASKSTGLSMYFLRRGCWDGSIPHVKSGGTYYINVPALLRSLGATQEPEPPTQSSKVTEIREAAKRRARA